MILRYKRKTVTTRQSLNLFVAGLLLLPIYIDLMATFSKTMGFNTKITTYIYYGALWFLLALSIPKILSAITGKMVLGAMTFTMLVAVQHFLFPNSRDYILGTPSFELISFSPATLLAVVPYILMGAAVTDLDVLERILHTCARVGIVMGALSYVVAIVDGHEIHYDDMNNAYALCIMVCLLVADYKKHDVYFLVIGFLSLLLAGTRGPLICALVAVLLRTVFQEWNQAKRMLKILAGILAIVMLQSNLLLGFLNLLSMGFSTIGVTNLRIVDYMRDGVLIDTSGRDLLADRVVRKIWENPFFGYGVGGDRTALTSETYVHNIFLEMWASYGIILGTVLLGWMAYWLIKGIGSKDHALRVIATALFSSVVVKLFLSSSYLYAKELFMLLGICMAGCAAQRRSTVKEPEVRNGRKN